MAGPEDVTLVENAVHNPNEPRHFMRVVPAAGSYKAVAKGTVVATSDAVLVVKEVGRDIYDPVAYFPRESVDMNLLRRINKSTHCPLKGDTEYFDVVVGDRLIVEAAWSYVEMVQGAEALQSYISFDATKVAIGAAR